MRSLTMHKLQSILLQHKNQKRRKYYPKQSTKPILTKTQAGVGVPEHAYVPALLRKSKLGKLLPRM